MTLSMRLRHVGIVEWVDVIPLIVGGLGTVSKNFEMWLEKIKGQPFKSVPTGNYKDHQKGAGHLRLERLSRIII